MNSYAAILTALDGGPETDVTLAAALAMGRDFEAYVEALQVSADPQTTAPMVANGMTGSMVDQLMASLEEDVKARETQAAK
ncbi:MAG: hypothetical protein R3316_10035, partial [Rhodovibrionaceae bacterium]|nr:hypothetical protein [Rhodovibrionaceae bacterium]